MRKCLVHMCTQSTPNAEPTESGISTLDRAREGLEAVMYGESIDKHIIRNIYEYGV